MKFGLFLVLCYKKSEKNEKILAKSSKNHYNYNRQKIFCLLIYYRHTNAYYNNCKIKKDADTFY